jgi:hypothetical protein
MTQHGKALEITGEWECMECGYIEEGNEAQRPPKCPECGAPASALEFFSEEEDWARAEFEDDEGYEDSDEFDELDEFDEYEEDDDR